jgi:hypothetical protein
LDVEFALHFFESLDSPKLRLLACSHRINPKKLILQYLTEELYPTPGNWIVNLRDKMENAGLKKKSR